MGKAEVEEGVEEITGLKEPKNKIIVMSRHPEKEKGKGWGEKVCRGPEF